MPGMAEIADWLAGAALANSFVALLLIALLPIVIVAFARNSIGASIVIVGTVVGLVFALTTDLVFWPLAFFGVLWLVAIGFLIFGRPRRASRSSH
jgi:hypothetical protein